MDSQKRYASTSSSLSLSPTSSSSSSSSCHSEDRLVKTEEIEAAETLAYLARLAMRHTAHSADKCCIQRDTCRFTSDSPIPDWDPPPLGGQAVASQQLDEKMSSTTSVKTERIRQNDCLTNMKMEQDNDLPKTTHCNKSRRNLTEEEKEARRLRRVLANRESARQTIRRRQALSEELSRKAATLAMENENLKRRKELALKEYQSLETTNKLLKEQIAQSINTEVEKTPVEQESSMSEVAPTPGTSPWFIYNHFPVGQLFWPSILPSSNQVQLQQTPFNSIAIPSHVYVPCSTESESLDKQNNLINDNQTQSPLYMFPCPWLYPPPEIGNGQPPPSCSLEDEQDNLPLSKQCSTTLCLNSVGNVDYHATLPIKLKTETSDWTESRSSNDPSHATPSFSLDGGEQKTRCHIIEKFHAPAVNSNGYVSVVKQEPGLQLHSTSNTKASSTTSHIRTSQEKKQQQFICSGKNLVDAVSAAEARKRRKELTKLKSIQSRQSRMEC